MSDRYRSLRVLEVIDETHDTRSIVFEQPADDPQFAYRAGQYLTLRLPIDDRRVVRCYSLASTPGIDAHLRVTVKRVAQGRGSNWICDQVKAGDHVDVMPPAGLFTPVSPDDCFLLFAGGSGITPVFSIIRHVLAHGSGRCELFYANRDEASIIFRAELHALAQQHGDRLKVRHWLDDRDGVPTVGTLLDFAAGAGRAEVAHAFVCGPTPFMDATVAALAQCGMPEERVHVERFSSLPDEEEVDAARAQRVAAPEGTAGASVTLQLNGERHELVLRARETLLDGALRIGLDAPFSCQAGQCSTCVCRVVEGAVDMAVNEVLSVAEVQAGMALACQAVPRTPRVVAEFA